MHPMIIFYRDGQLQAAENALEALKHLCFLHNAFLESGDTGTAALLKRAVINIDRKKLEQVDILNACYEDARAVADMVEQAFPKLNGKVVINSIGTVIGSHTGPGTVALFFWGDQRKE